MNFNDDQIIALENYFLIKQGRDEDLHRHTSKALQEFDQDPRLGVRLMLAERRGDTQTVELLTAQREAVEAEAAQEFNEGFNAVFPEGENITSELERNGITQEGLEFYANQHGLGTIDDTIDDEQQAQRDGAEQIQDNQTEPNREQERGQSERTHEFNENPQDVTQIESNTRTDVDDRQLPPEGDDRLDYTSTNTATETFNDYSSPDYEDDDPEREDDDIEF